MGDSQLGYFRYSIIEAFSRLNTTNRALVAQIMRSLELRKVHAFIGSGSWNAKSFYIKWLQIGGYFGTLIIICIKTMKRYCPDPALSAVFKVYLYFCVHLISQCSKSQQNINCQRLMGGIKNAPVIKKICNNLHNILESVMSIIRPEVSTADIMGNSTNLRDLSAQRIKRINAKLKEDFNEVVQLYGLSDQPRQALKQMNTKLQKHLSQKKHIVIIESEVEPSRGTQFYTPQDDKIKQIETYQPKIIDFRQYQNQGICYILAPFISIFDNKNLQEIKGKQIADAITIHKDRNQKLTGQLTVTLYYCGVEHRVHMTTRLPNVKLDWLGLAYIEKALAIIYGNSYRMLENHEVCEFPSTGFSIIKPVPAYIVPSKQENKLDSNKNYCFAHSARMHCCGFTSSQNNIIDPLKPEIRKPLHQGPSQQNYITTRADFLPNLSRQVIELLQTDKPRYKHMNRFDLSLKVKLDDTYFFLNFHQMSRIMAKLGLWNPAACLALIIDNKQKKKRLEVQSFIERQEESDSCLKIGPLKLDAGEYTLVILEGVFEERMPSRVEAFYSQGVDLSLINPSSPEANTDWVKQTGGYNEFFKDTKDIKSQDLQSSISIKQHPIDIKAEMSYRMCIVKLRITSKNLQNVSIYDLYKHFVISENLALTMPLQMVEDRIVIGQTPNGNKSSDAIELYFFVAHGVKRDNPEIFYSDQIDFNIQKHDSQIIEEE